ncbi:MAG TPA: glycosyltransferase family 2 protein [Terriglobia bacterium]|nr:glycosyltransferase family 2 protein [Terriglobia bacterium]
MPAISATIIAHNEAANIARAIRSLSCADEVVVVDSGSTDNTAEVARSCGARVVTHAWEGFAAQKNFATSQAQYDWILSLDADEELNDAAIKSVQQWKNATPGAFGYQFARCAFYLGRWIRHSGWYPDFKVRLFDRRKGGWKGAYVHESVEVAGRAETLAGEILHYTCDSLDEHAQRIEFYTDLAAQEMLDRGEKVGKLRRTLGPPWVFLNTYLFRLGMLDGKPGYLIAKMAARYVRRKYAKVEEMRKRSHAHP